MPWKCQKMGIQHTAKQCSENFKKMEKDYRKIQECKKRNKPKNYKVVWYTGQWFGPQLDDVLDDVVFLKSQDWLIFPGSLFPVHLSCALFALNVSGLIWNVVVAVRCLSPVQLKSETKSVNNNSPKLGTQKFKVDVSNHSLVCKGATPRSPGFSTRQSVEVDILGERWDNMHALQVTEPQGCLSPVCGKRWKCQR